MGSSGYGGYDQHLAFLGYAGLGEARGYGIVATEFAFKSARRWMKALDAFDYAGLRGGKKKLVSTSQAVGASILPRRILYIHTAKASEVINITAMKSK